MRRPGSTRARAVAAAPEARSAAGTQGFRGGWGDPQLGALICSALRGDRADWPADAGEAFAAALVEEAGQHGVCGLLDRRRDNILHWPAPVLKGIRVHAADAAFWEDRHRTVLMRLTSELAARGIEPVFLKGTALAYAHYPLPELRKRSDSDLLIPAAQREGAREALAAAGFEPAMAGGREVFTQQRLYATVDGDGFEHLVDLHWQLNDSPFLSRLLGTEGVIARSVPLPALGARARAADPVDLLLLACVHREVHCLFGETLSAAERGDGIPYRDPGLLIWLEDLRLLADGMRPEEWGRVLDRAFAAGLAGICADALGLARSLLGAPCPDEVILALSRAPRREPAADYLRASVLARQWIDLRAVEGGRRKARFVREAVLPSGDYMRRLYADRPTAWLPWLYVERAATRGAARLRAALGL